MFDESIVSHIQRRHGILIGEATAERVKQTIATAWSESEHMEMELKGRDIAEGLSRSLIVTSEEIYEALKEPLAQIVHAIRKTLEKTPPELSADIGDKGMVVAGGGALLRDLDRRLSQDTGLAVVVPEDPMTCVVRGCGIALEEIDAISDIFVYDKN